MEHIADTLSQFPIPAALKPPLYSVEHVIIHHR
jgi:hypothetical protein